MSYYNHMHDEKDNIAKCDNCQKKFAWSEDGPFYPGGTDTEIVRCPYCKEIYTTIRSNGFVSSREISQDNE